MADSSVWQEYLVAGSARTNHPIYHVDEQAAHTQLALLCMCYIGILLERSRRSGGYEVPSQSTHISRTRVGGSDAGARSTTYHGSPVPSSHSTSLDEYVLSWGFRHLAHINLRNREILHAIKTLHSDAQQHPSEWERLCRRSSLWPTLKHDFVLSILITFAPPLLLRSFIGRVQLKWKDGTNPLIYAARFGKVEHARILLSSGVSLNHRGWDTDLDHHQLLPLEAAIRRNDFHMVNLFLIEGSSVPHKLFVSALELHCPIPGQIVSRLLQTDEFVEWAANVWDEVLLLRSLDPTRYLVNRTFAISQQDIDVIERRCVQIGCDPSTRFNETSLRHAVTVGHTSTVQCMLSQNTPFPPDIILDASRSMTSNAEMIHLCLNMGSDIHAVSSTEDTPLHLTLTFVHSEDDCLENVQILIDAGCNPSRCNLAGETPLHLAVRNGFISIAEYLLALHVPLPPDILLAASESHKASIICLLTSQGANVHAIAANGDTLLHWILQDPQASSEDILDCVKVILNSGCDPYLPNALGKTPFDVAAENGHLLVVQYLHSTLDYPFSPGILLSITRSGSSGATQLIRFLIDKGADIHVTHPSGDTLLHLAMLVDSDLEAECLRRTELLVNAGCDPRVCNLAGETPFHIAAREGHISVMDYFLLLGISVPSDIMLIRLERFRSYRDHYPVVRFLLENGGDVHSVAKNGDTLLHVAAIIYPEEDALQSAKYLVHAGCIPHALNSLQETPLHIAAQRGYTSVVKYLLSLDTELPPDILLTASLGYSNSNIAPLIHYLVEEGASVSATTTDGDTPLHLLLTQGEEYDLLECVKLLVDAGCDPHAHNLAGETPLHRAARHGYSSILEYLLSQDIPLPHDILLACETSTALQFFLGKGLDLSRVSTDGVTALMHRVLDFNWSQVEYDTVGFARILIGAGWDPVPQNSAGKTTIHIAAMNGDLAAIKFFLSQNVPLPSDILLAAVSLPIPALIDLYMEQAITVTRFLIHEGASVNVAASNGNTPLHLVMMHDFLPDQIYHSTEKLLWKLVEILVNGGSDPSARNMYGQTPYDIAEAKGYFFKENFLRLVWNSSTHRLQYS